MLRKRGHRRIALGGHSGGAVRPAYAKATERFESVVAVMGRVARRVRPRGGHRAAWRGLLRAVPGVERNVAEGLPDVLLVREFHGAQRVANAPTANASIGTIAIAWPCTRRTQAAPRSSRSAQPGATWKQPATHTSRFAWQTGPPMATWDGRKNCLRRDFPG